MKMIKTAFLIICVFFSGCTGKAVKDNEIVIVDSSPKIQKNIEEASSRLDIKGIVPFRKLDYSRLPGSMFEMPVIAASSDEKVMFLMERVAGKDEPYSLMGQRFEKVNLIKFNIETGEKYIIAKEIPFINIAKWNNEGNIIAFCGGWELRLYDTVKNRFILQDDLKNDSVTYFGWSPDGKKLFTEHPNLINGSICYVNYEKMLHSYETKENLYYKGKLDDNYFYGSKMLTIEQTRGNIEYRMVIIDKDGQVLNESIAGRFRDSYEKSMLHLGEAGAGLYYYPDVNNINKSKTITESFVYDAKFIEGGRIAYIDGNKILEKNDFILHILDTEGNETMNMEVSGPVFSLSPDGKVGFIGGSRWEKIDFTSNKIIGTGHVIEGRYSEEDEKVFNTVRGAMDTWYKVELLGSSNNLDIDKYFIDTENPEQWAKFDMTQMAEARKGLEGYTGKEVDIKLYLKSYKRYNTDGIERASIAVTGGAENSGGSGVGISQSLELVKKNDNWYVTGFSTFPESKQSKEVRKKAEQFVKEAQSGKHFDGILKDKEIQIGQIQFWQLSDPHLADDAENTNYCKVYLKVKENDKEIIYKLVLDKKNQNFWKPYKLTSDRLYWLF